MTSRSTLSVLSSFYASSLPHANATCSRHSGHTSHNTRNTASTALKLHFDRAVLNCAMCFSDFLAISHHHREELRRDVEIKIYVLYHTPAHTKQVRVSHALLEGGHELAALLIQKGRLLSLRASLHIHQVVGHAVPVHKTHVVNVLCRRGVHLTTQFPLQRDKEQGETPQWCRDPWAA